MDKEDDKFFRDDSCNKLQSQRPSSRRRNTCDDKKNISPGQNANFNPNVSKYESIRMLNIDRSYSLKEVKVNNKILDIKHYPDN